MTLIYTVISNLGIVQASDSNLTGDGGTVDLGPKLFQVGIGNAVLALAGTYSVGGVSMDAWIPATVTAFADKGDQTLAGFAAFLGRRLTEEIAPEEGERGTLIQIGGYVEAETKSHPEMWFVRNIAGIDDVTGDYVGRSDVFQVSEDFWQRDFKTLDTKQALQSGGFQRYMNGFPPGRVAFVGLGQMLWSFLTQVWSKPDWKFRAPSSLEQLASLVELQMQAICVLFRSSEYDAPYIGGPIQIEMIPPPPNALAM